MRMVPESWAKVARRWVSWGDVASRSRGGGVPEDCWAALGLARLGVSTVES